MVDYSENVILTERDGIESPSIIITIVTFIIYIKLTVVIIIVSNVGIDILIHEDAAPLCKNRLCFHSIRMEFVIVD